MRTIDADSLMPLFMEKANTMKDRHGVKLGEEWLLNYNDIKDVIDNAPTIDDLSEYSDKLWQKAYERGKAEARPQGEWIEHWSEDLQKMGFRQCSKCKAGYQLYEHGTRKSDLSWIDGQQYTLQRIGKFCPNCGAKMTMEAENDR